MRVLVIGGTRFVGYLVTWRLLAAGHQVTLFNRGIHPDPFEDRVERLQGDRTTTDFERILARRDFDAAVDFAAYQRPDATSVLRTLADRVGHYVFVSTGQVYLVRTGCPVPAREADYAGPCMPRPEAEDEQGQWDYGAGKRDCEDELAAAWDRARFPSTRIRIPIVHGERDPDRRLEPYLWRLLDGSPVILPDGGTHPMRHVYSHDVARTLVALLGRTETFGQAYNLCQEETVTLAELVAILRELLGACAPVARVSSEALRDAGLTVRDLSPLSSRWMSRLDPTLARSALGFVHTPLREYLARIVTSFLADLPDEPAAYTLHRGTELAVIRRAMGAT